ncbi:MAG: DUF2125 domain-containing protein [Gemmobacter sp.]
MRRLLGVVLALSALWGGYWFVGATVLERGVRDWLAAQAPQVQAAGADVAGFPNRFDLTLTDLAVGEGGPMVWRAPFLQVFALSYKPWHLIAAFPPDQSLVMADGGELGLTADKLQASVVASPSRALTLDRIVVAGEGLALRLAMMPVVQVGELRLGTRRDPSRKDTHDIGLDLVGLRPDPALNAASAGLRLPQGDATVHVEASIAFSAPVDRFAGQTQPTPEVIEITAMQLVWGEIEIDGTGRLTPDENGFAAGQIDLTLSGWDQALDIAVSAGAMQPGIAATWAEFARRKAETSGQPGRASLPLVMKGGEVWLDFFSLGPAPRLRS